MPSMSIVGSFCVSFFFGLSVGGMLNTSFDGVSELLRVSTHLLFTLWSVGASSETVPSKRTWMRGLVPARHWPIVSWSVTVRVSMCLESSHLVVYFFLDTGLPVFRSIISRVCLSGFR